MLAGTIQRQQAECETDTFMKYSTSVIFSFFLYVSYFFGEVILMEKRYQLKIGSSGERCGYTKRIQMFIIKFNFA